MTDTFRKVYTPITEQQRGEMNDLKAAADNLLDLMNESVPAADRSESSRCMAIARTNLEQSIIWAVKGITSKGQ
jgi:hypothetical protein